MAGRWSTPWVFTWSARLHPRGLPAPTLSPRACRLRGTPAGSNPRVAETRPGHRSVGQLPTRALVGPWWGRTPAPQMICFSVSTVTAGCRSQDLHPESPLPPDGSCCHSAKASETHRDDVCTGTIRNRSSVPWTWETARHRGGAGRGEHGSAERSWPHVCESEARKHLGRGGNSLASPLLLLEGGGSHSWSTRGPASLPNWSVRGASGLAPTTSTRTRGHRVPHPILAPLGPRQNQALRDICSG